MQMVGPGPIPPIYLAWPSVAPSLKPVANRLTGRLLNSDESLGPIWPVSLDEAKAHAQVDHEDDDLIFLSADGYRGLIPAATQFVELRANQALITQTRRQTFDGTLGNVSEFELPLGPLQSVESLKYLDDEYTETTVVSTSYRAMTAASPGRVSLKLNQAWPATASRGGESVWCDYTCGFGDTPAAVPPALCHCVLLLAAYWYEHRFAFATGKVDAYFVQALDRTIEGAGGLCRYV